MVPGSGMMDPMPEVTFVATDGQVEVRRGERVTWSGRIHDVSVLDAFALPGTSDGIVVLDWMDDPEGVAAWQPYRNLLRIRADGTEVWRAELPGEDKSFTGARLEGGDLIATAWRHRCTVDPATGHLVDTVPVD